jgi:hypothetical protein
MSRQKLEELKNKVKTAVRLFIENDGELLSLSGGIHEQTISHRIAVYLECLFRRFHVDCEYNKHGVTGDNKKVVENITELKRGCLCKSCKKWCRENPIGGTIRDFSEIRPDIIIHKERGKANTGNILVIEIKKVEECLFDEGKLKSLTDKNGDYKYDLGVFVYFSENQPKYKWFINGIEEIER